MKCRVWVTFKVWLWEEDRATRGMGFRRPSEGHPRLPDCSPRLILPGLMCGLRCVVRTIPQKGISSVVEDDLGPAHLLFIPSTSPHFQLAPKMEMVLFCFQLTLTQVYESNPFS